MNPFLTENEFKEKIQQPSHVLSNTLWFKKSSQDCYLNIEPGYKHRLGNSPHNICYIRIQALKLQKWSSISQRVGNSMRYETIVAQVYCGHVNFYRLCTSYIHIRQNSFAVINDFISLEKCKRETGLHKFRSLSWLDSHYKCCLLSE